MKITKQAINKPIETVECPFCERKHIEYKPMSIIQHLHIFCLCGAHGINKPKDRPKTDRPDTSPIEFEWEWHESWKE